ncbi:hypothetical protein [Nesterenkonia sp. NBAIMH1]|uniref:hypothetical protein n=1 Tax=Nesterenkonia sp. NBAIMH1 TaxID=2600320 RepID=UPI0011B76CB3|nr:hypothetical protein [Nesterenkonia sp. NBAIMH1]
MVAGAAVQQLEQLSQNYATAAQKLLEAAGLYEKQQGHVVQAFTVEWESQAAGLFRNALLPLAAGSKHARDEAEALAAEALLISQELAGLADQARHWQAVLGALGGIDISGLLGTAAEELRPAPLGPHWRVR